MSVTGVAEGGVRAAGGLAGLTFWSGPQQFRVVPGQSPVGCGYVMAERVGGGYAVPFAVGLFARLVEVSGAGAREVAAGGLTLPKACVRGGSDE